MHLIQEVLLGGPIEIILKVKGYRGRTIAHISRTFWCTVYWPKQRGGVPKWSNKRYGRAS